VSFKKSSNISANSLLLNNGKYKIYGSSGFLKTIDFYTEDKPYIAIVKDGSVGNSFICDSNSSVLGTLDIIQNKDDMNLYFLYLLLSKIKFSKYVQGSSIPHIYYKDYSVELLPIPTLAEQEKIASFLTTIDEELALLTSQIEKTQNYKQGLLQQMFI
jgi:type I restriction enzyme S subunit